MKKLFKISACIVAFLLILFIASCDNHKHTYEGDYTYNATEHWHKANCGHDDISGKEAHAFSDWKVALAPTEILTVLKEEYVQYVVILKKEYYLN